MKTVYIPTEEELNSLEKNGANIYLYLLAKTIETIIMNDVIYGEIDMQEFVYDEFSEYPEIIYALAKMYPERFLECKRAMSDPALWAKIISTSQKTNSSIYGLDYIPQLPEELLQKPIVIKSVIQTLSQLLNENPRYRFEYREPNSILDEIFACEISFETMPTELIDSLAYLEPIYYARLGIIFDFDKNKLKNMHPLIERSVLQYAVRYGLEIHNYQFHKTASQDVKIRKLVKYLQEHKQTISIIKQ